MAFNRKVPEIGQGNLGPSWRDLLRQQQSPQHLNNFDVNQLGGVEPLCRIEDASGDSLRTGCAQDQLDRG
jgi:hypothetical protein